MKTKPFDYYVTAEYWNQEKKLSASSIVPNGSYLKTDFRGIVFNSKEIYILGDANLDGLVTAADARKILRVSACLEDSEAYMISDIDRDREITATDARSVLRYSAALIDYETFSYDFIKIFKNERI